MAEALRSDLAGPRVVMGLLSAFGLLAALLSALGVYGLMSYSVAQRRHEIGIRLALGAKRIDVLKSVVGQAFQSALIGTGVGLVMALAMTSIMSGMLFGIGPRNATTFVLVAVFISGIAIVASYIPARRGSRIDPAETLR
jgi:putative ABC transport system permease protein